MRAPAPEANPGDVARKRRRRVFGALATVIGSGLALALALGWLGPNLRVVEPHRLYRSAQLSPTQLAEVIRSLGIRSVINLRGESSATDAERVLCQQLGIAHRDLALSARRLPPPDELKALLEAFDTLPQPILVHCFGGADRTGLACTIYEHVNRGKPLDLAQHQQLTWRYGHLPAGPTQAMDRFFDLYRRTAGRRNLKDWIGTSYPTLYQADALAPGARSGTLPGALPHGLGQPESG